MPRVPALKCRASVTASRRDALGFPAFASRPRPQGHARRDHGFTLLEMMIAVSLGMLIVYTAVAGFRAAASGITTANRMALSNVMLRAAFIQALEEVDWWQAYDVPSSDVASDQKLRSVQVFRDDPSRTQGLPFAPFEVTAPVTRITATGTLFGAENDLGWDSAYQWPSADPRTWWRGNAAEQANTDLRMGDHALYADTTDDVPHPWLMRQIDHLRLAIGYQGMCEYLPANQLYALISSTSRQRKNGGKTLDEFLRGGGSNFPNGDGGTSFAQGRYRPTKDTSFGIPPLRPKGGPLAMSDYFRWVRGKEDTGNWSSANDITGFFNAMRSDEPLLAQRPSHWPAVTVGVARYLSHNRFAATCWISWTDPLSGQVSELSFNGFGTTLRGARQQRRPGTAGSGWATWYAAGDRRNSPTLDSPATSPVGSQAP